MRKTAPESSVWFENEHQYNVQWHLAWRFCSSLHKHAMQCCHFNNNIALIGGNFMSISHRHKTTLNHSQHSDEQMHFFFFEKCHDVHLCLMIYLSKQIKISEFVVNNCALQKFWALLDLSQTLSSLLCRWAAHFEDVKVCINGFSQFLYVPHEVRQLSFFWIKDLFLGLDCSDLDGNS